MPDPRLEGLYPRWETYPPQGGPYSRQLLIIERVNGDGSVSTVVCTPDEALTLRPVLEQARP